MTGALRARYDVVVIGAGPAGLAAASACARAGLATALIDEQPAPGGQIHRGITSAPAQRVALLGRSYAAGARRVDALHASGAELVSEASAWSLSPVGEIGVSRQGTSTLLHARRVILATGALERPFPIPGWTLPGVMTAGAGQILLKTAGLVPHGRVVLAGCGPLLWLVAWQYLRAGVAIEALLDTTDRAQRARSRRHAPAFMASPYAVQGLTLVARVRRHVRVVTDVTGIRAEGDGRVRSVTFTRSGRDTPLPADLLLLHQGVVPDTHLAMAAGVEHRWDDVQLAWLPVIDALGRTSIDCIAIAGDAAGIGGADAAEQRGVLAAIGAIRELAPHAPAPDERAVRTRLARCMRGRAFLDVRFRPHARFRQPEGATLACRCEEVTAAAIRDAAALGCTGPNQAKALLRCGMGLCQGRLCGLTVTELIAATRAVSPAEVGHYRVRPPVKPITVAELAALPKTPAAIAAVVRE